MFEQMNDNKLVWAFCGVLFTFLIVNYGHYVTSFAKDIANTTVEFARNITENKINEAKSKSVIKVGEATLLKIIDNAETIVPAALKIIPAMCTALTFVSSVFGSGSGLDTADFSGLNMQ